MSVSTEHMNKAREAGREAFRSISGQWTDAHFGKHTHFAAPPKCRFSKPGLRAEWSAGWNELNTAWCDSIYAD